MPSPVQSNCDAHDTIANGQYGAVWSMDTHNRTIFMNSVAGTLNRVTDMEFNNQISALTPNNWNTWKHDMQVLLMHYGCWQFIIQTKTEQPDEEATYKEKKLDLQLRGFLRNSVYRATNLQMERKRTFQELSEVGRADIRSQSSSVDETRFGEAENAYLNSFTSKEVEDVTWCYGCSSWRSKWQE
ncbi:hypothetical protein TNCV_4134261 [Trichonephila clavipes]|nr:hypothetical protein TNCV_4134261 [Trichonephila clavipes]